MEFEYMRELENNPNLSGIVNEGFNELEVNSLQEKYNKGQSFPRSRQFVTGGDKSD